jgi:hypothetical protein
MKYLYLVLALVFTSFVVVQYNDPDPYIWVPLYGYAAVLSFLMFLNRLNNIIWPIIGWITYLITAVIFWPGTFKGMENTMTIMNPEIEQARETSGALICAATMVFYLIMIRRRKK